MALSKEEFEEKCMDIIKRIVLLKYDQTRLDAVAISEKMLEKAQSKPASVISIYERVVEEFKNCSDKEYEILKKQLFSEE